MAQLRALISRRVQLLLLRKWDIAEDMKVNGNKESDMFLYIREL